MSKCNYLLQCISATQGIIAKIERLLFKFLWNDKNEKNQAKTVDTNLRKWWTQYGRCQNTIANISNKMD